jgi:hypothetical protein
MTSRVGYSPYTPPFSTHAYIVPDSDDVADGPEAFRRFADSMPADFDPVIPINNVSTDYTLDVSDNGGLVSVDTTDADLILTIPKLSGEFTMPVGAAVAVLNFGTTRKRILTLRPEAGVLVRDLAVRKVQLYRIVVLIQIAENVWIINAGQGDDDKITTPTEPLTPSVVKSGTGIVTVSWVEPMDDGGSPILQYIVEVRLPGEQFVSRGVANGAALSCVVGGLPEKQEIAFRVLAVNTKGASDPSSEVKVTL